MIWFSERVLLGAYFKKWADENNADKKSPENVVAFLQTNNLLNEKEVHSYCERKQRSEQLTGGLIDRGLLEETEE